MHRKGTAAGILMLCALACGGAGPVQEGGPAPGPATSEVTMAAPAPGHYRLAGDEIIFSDEATDEDMAVLDAHPHLKRIAFSRGPNARPPIRITQRGLAHLASVKHLERLHLADVPVPDDALAPVAGLADLRELWLDFNPHLTDRVLAYVAPLEGLRVLRFHMAGITDAGLLLIARLTRLEDLQLGHARVTDAGLATIARFTELRTLDLQYTGVTDRGMLHLEALTKLRWLCVNGTAVSGAALASIEGLTDLEWLFAARTNVDDASLARLKDLSRLHDLDLSQTRVTDAGLTHLTRLKSLERLRLDDCAITDRGLQILAGLRSLKALSLRGTAVSRGAVDAVRAGRPDLSIEG
ncbi:hypothetical protein SAMN02745121_06542 [Nannocystis exedens]|uniref:F-box/LRR-repeat protein 15-like leucin rich repeat domain-containing protein n=2 Tax=Nannocystis exedens TaxID=54 RepID=A0A1I2FAH3_9BACT|nr:Internalin-A precursor [Nannocystis exedens]SFF01758.1 hypothetical protein SAMN02745121_06542 [Nannocystis exedens]